MVVMTLKYNFRDAMMQSLVEHTSLDVQAYKPVILFLNGEYWGIYNIRGFDKYYLRYYGVSEEELVIMEGQNWLKVQRKMWHITEI